jgi:Uma2 family endonuclease
MILRCNPTQTLNLIKKSVGERMSLTTKDLEKLQTDYPDYRMELVDGEIIVMSPSGYESDEVATRFTIKLVFHALNAPSRWKKLEIL